MDTKFINFQKKEISAINKEAAKESAPFQIIGDATQAYKKFKEEHNTGFSESELKAFFLDYLSKKSKQAAGVGYMVTLESAALNTRERPYKVTNVKNEGKRKWKTVREIIDKKTGEVIVTVDTTKADAVNKAKELFKNGLQHSVIVKAVKSTENCVEAEVAYVPSKGSHYGSYLVFGIVAE